MTRFRISYEGLPLVFEDDWANFLAMEAYAEWHAFLGQITRQSAPLIEKPLDETQRRWQILLESLALCAVPEEDRLEMSCLELIETALYTLQATIEGEAWVDEGVSFLAPALVGEIDGEMIALPETLDLREAESIAVILKMAMEKDPSP